MSKMGMQSPWVAYGKLVRELFEEPDPDVTVEFDDDPPALRIYVRGADKAESMAEVLPREVTFGGAGMPVEVVPANDVELTMADHMRRAFAGNPVLAGVVERPIVPGGPALTYALFAPEAAQVACDNAGSPYGLRTATYEEIAREVLAAEGVLISSEML